MDISPETQQNGVTFHASATDRDEVTVWAACSDHVPRHLPALNFSINITG